MLKIASKVAYILCTLLELFLAYIFIRNGMYGYLLILIALVISANFAIIFIRKRKEKAERVESWNEFVRQYAEHEREYKNRKDRERGEKIYQERAQERFRKEEQERIKREKEEFGRRAREYQQQQKRDYERQYYEYNSTREQNTNTEPKGTDWFSGLSPKAAKNKYRTLMKKYHPDNSATGNTDLAQEIQAAYDSYLEENGLS